MRRKYLAIILITLIVLSTGCTDKDISSIVNSIPEIQQYLKEHPNAKITTTYWTKNDVSKSLDEISKQCDRTIASTDMYKIVVQEENLKVISWIDANTRTLVCSSTEGSVPLQTNEEIYTKTTPMPTVYVSTHTVIHTTSVPIPTRTKSADITEDSSDNKFQELTKEINRAIIEDLKLFPSESQDDEYFKKLKTFGQTLESDSETYLAKIEKITVSSNLQPVYNEYKAYVTYNKIAGVYCKLSSEYHDQGDSDKAILNLKKCTLNLKKGTLALTKAKIYS